MNKKGFTLVELLAVLVLISLLMGLAIPGINRISNNMKKKSYNQKIKLVESAAELWGQDNKTRLQATTNCPSEIIQCKIITIEDLITDNYLDSDNNSGNYINPKNDKDMKNCKVFVYKQNKRVYAKYDNSDSVDVACK